MQPRFFWRRGRGYFRTWLIGLGVVVFGVMAAGAAPVDFNSEVRPLLSSRCFSCHGPDEESRKGKLRLDLGSEARRELGGLWPIKPGAPEQSEVWARITTTEATEVMPPAKAGDRLGEHEIELIRRWIAEGAVYAEHWAWIRPERPVVPAVGGSSWPRNELDHFILARQLDRNLAPSAEADGYTLARRLALDLTGLPPTLDQVKQLAGGEDAAAYERLVDQLLGSPHFGEHWARMWMDLARYADSAGYGSDPLRPNLWPWRDWVIAALNRNLPYDQFTIEQLAGDLIPEATEDQRVATGFHRNTMTNTEGGTDDEEYRVAAVKDRANTTAQVWMGLTLGCAQCHTHKFDPISQREYYQFYGFFNQTEDHDQPDERPTLPRPTVMEARQLAEWKQRLADLEKQWAWNSPELDADLATWESAQRQEVAWPLLVPAGWRSYRGAEFELGEDGFLHVRSLGGPDTQVLTVPLELQGMTALRIEWARSHSTPVDATDRPEDIPVRLTEMKVAVRASDGVVPRARYVRIELPGPRRVLSLAEVQVLGPAANLARTGSVTQSSTEGAGVAERAIDGNNDGDFASGTVTETRPEDSPWWEVDLGREESVEAILVWNRTDAGLGTRMTDFKVIALDQKREPVWSRGVGDAPSPVVELRLSAETPLVLGNATTRFSRADRPVEQVIDGNLDAGNGWAPGSANARVESAVFEVRDAPITVTNSQMTVVLTWSGPKQWTLDGFRLSATTRPHPVRELAQELREILAIRMEDRTTEQMDQLRDHVRGFAPSKAGIDRELRETRRQLAGLKPVAVPILRELPPEHQRTTRVLHKGNFLDPGEVVEPGVPAAFHPWPEGARMDRLSLARWLVSRDNPLTARVMVNRLWARLFGRGLVETEEDFGTQGTLPSHPELLDWLAVEFMDRGWDVKAMLRLMVTSAAYRQSAVLSSELLAQDPRNQWLARASRSRLDAEVVRDQALALAGLLSPKLGGPSVFPPQPDGLWRAAFNGERDYPTSAGEDRYRRGLYVFVRRTVPNPTLAMFDAPSRETCTFRRQPTNTPLQAFVTLNDPVYVEAARGLARRILREGGGDNPTRARYAWRLCLGRPPSAEQEAILNRHLDQELAHYGRQVDAARELIAEPGETTMTGERAIELAAWTSVANVLLNLDALMNRG